jgi:hypothetical protein
MHTTLTAAPHAPPRAIRARYTLPPPLTVPHSMWATSTTPTYCTTCPSDEPFAAAIGATTCRVRRASVMQTALTTAPYAPPRAIRA